MRGFAGLIVVVAHLFGEPKGGVENLQFGWFGVQIFFVLSGYLIGGLILDGRDRAGFWPAFLVRRTARLLPLYFAVLAAVGVMSLTFEWAPSGFPAWTYLSFTQNIYSAVSGIRDALWLEPLWTLAVEEQFYLALPVLVLTLPRAFLPIALLILICVAPLYRVVAMANGEEMALLMLPGRMDLLGAGVLVAWAVRQLDLRPFLPALRFAPIPLLLACPAIYLAFDLHTFAIYGQGLVAAAAASFIAALALGAPDGRRFLNLSGLRFLGTISYGLYLIHQPVNVALHGMSFGETPSLESPARLAVTVAAMGLSLLLASASWLLLERPIIALSRRSLAIAPLSPAGSSPSADPSPVRR